jgi:hypothetical protein
MTQPVVRADGLDRSAADCSEPELDDAADFWTEVHERVQQQLSRLEGEVRRRLTSVRVDKGRTRGARFYLFSYRTFSIPDSGLDPVVAGMTFTPTHEGVTVETDVSGEHLGDRISAVPSKMLANRRAQILAAADELGGKLSQSADAVSGALKDLSRRVD